MAATKVFTVQAREWAEADQPAVHARNVAVLRRSLDSMRALYYDVRFLSESANRDGASVDLTYEITTEEPLP